MGLRIKLLALMLGIIFFLFVIRFIRRKAIKPSYASLWLAVAVFLVSIPIFEWVYTWITYSVLGLTDGTHTIYIGLIGFLLVYAFYVTTKMSRMEDHVRELISFTAIHQQKLSSVS